MICGSWLVIWVDWGFSSLESSCVVALK
uniref:Uncharacterized protein n=1 Tax=Arundo donax TaxID=35708 RepID=A0A0A9H3C1_ARUDO